MSGSANQRATNVSKQSIRGTMWGYVSYASGKLLTFLSTLILAYFLLPEQYGIVGFCLIAIQYLDVLNEAGTDAALVSRRDRIVEAANAAFVISIVFAFILFGVAWVSAPQVAAFFEEPAVTDLFRLFAIVLPVRALGTVPGAMLQRNLKFKRRVIPDLGRNISKGLVSIVMAWQGYGPLSLVVGQIVGEAIGVVLLWMLAGWRPSLQLDRQVTLEMSTFGGHIMLVGLAGAFQANADYLLVGKILGGTALGLYTFAYRVPELVLRSFSSVLDKVAHPILAQLQADAERLRAVYFGYVRYITLLMLPVGVGLAVIAPIFFTAFFRPEWAPATMVMQCVSIALAIRSIGYIPGILYKATNRPRILNQLAVIKLPTMLLVLWLGTFYGINGVAIGQLVLAFVYVTIDTVMVSRIFKFRISEMLRSLYPAVTATAVMALATISVLFSLRLEGLLGLITLVVVGAAAYLGTLSLVGRETVVQARTALRAAFSRN
jgi:O-antigen/teichoic acid export membrane protein